MSASQQIASVDETGFRIEPVFGLTSRRVMHPSSPNLAVALLDVELDGSLSLFPVEFERPPAPLTGEIIRFRSLAEVEGFLGLQHEEIAA